MKKIVDTVPAAQQRGCLIALEGIDGSGKTTLARALYEAFVQAGVGTVLTKEPGATAFGKEIRAMVQNPQHKKPALAEFLLFAADRVTHIAQVVQPALTAGKLVICDRMADSSIAYQGFGRGVDLPTIETVNAIALQGVQPDITFYLEVDYATAHERIMQRNEALSQFDKEKEGFFKRVMQGYEYVYAQRNDVLRTKDVAQLLTQLREGHMPPVGKERLFFLDAHKSPQELLDDVVQIMRWIDS